MGQQSSTTHELSRRYFLASSGLSLAATLPGRERAHRPNVLWVVSEDLTAELLSAYGNPFGRTPHIEKLARTGVRYANAFCPAPVCAPSRFSIITGVEATSCGPANNQRSQGRIPDWLHGFPKFLRDAGYYCTNNAKEDYNAQLGEMWDESSGTAHWRNRPSGVPFFSVFNFAVTHESNVHLWRVADAPKNVDPAAVQPPDYAPDALQLRIDRAAYYDKIMMLDDQIGELLEQLDADGLTDNTIIFYYSDNGGTLPRSKWYCYDTGLRVPLIIHFGKNFSDLAPASNGTTRTPPVSLLDLPLTMLHLANLRPPDYMQGRSILGDRGNEPRSYSFGFRDRVDERYEMIRSVHDERYHYIRNYLPFLPWGQHNAYMLLQVGYQEWERLYRQERLDSLRSRFWENKPAEELYDLQADPQELTNLAGNRDYAGVLTRLSRALDEHLLTVNDNGFIPEGSDLQGYERSRTPGAYPLPEIMEVARVAIQRRPRAVPWLSRRLDHPNEVVRYWAALGCVMLRWRAAAAAEALRSRLLDESWPVRIVAAEALLHLADDSRAHSVLSEALVDAAHKETRLQAANSLDRLGALALPVLPALQHARSDPWVVAKVASYTALKLHGTYPWHPSHIDGLSIDIPNRFEPGRDAGVTLRMTNHLSHAITDLDLRLTGPEKWTIDPAEPSPVDVLAPGATVETALRVTPADSARGPYLLLAEAVFTTQGTRPRIRWASGARVGANAQTVPALNDIGTMPDPAEANCTFQWWGDGYPTEELERVGLAAGAPVKQAGMTFVWPDVVPDTPDNVRLRRQRVPLAGSGSRLGFLGAAVYGNQNGTGTIHYEDGTRQEYALALTDWLAPEPQAGNELVARTRYIWKKGRRAETGGSIFCAEVTLHRNKALDSIVLPDNVKMHVFDMAIAS